jgi:hypothetical protein
LVFGARPVLDAARVTKSSQIIIFVRFASDTRLMSPMPENSTEFGPGCPEGGIGSRKRGKTTKPKPGARHLNGKVQTNEEL